MVLMEKNNVQVFSLGGLDEIGKNTYVIQYKNELIIVDAGIKFPDDELYGIDYIIPDYTYLIKNKDKIKGLFITHGHEDHIGGIPYLLKEIDIPIYAGKMALELIKEKLKEHNLINNAALFEIHEDNNIQFKNLSVQFFRTNHSIPDSFGIVIKTPQGNIVHTGDFKFDSTPIGPPANITKIASIGKEGVLCLLSDSTNSEVPGFSLSERIIGETIHDIYNHRTGRVIFATFASNVYRIKQAVEASIKNNRKIIILGRSLERAVRIAQDLGYIKIPTGVLVEPSAIKNLPDNQISVLCTGSQGEPFAALSRISNGNHRHLSINNNDTVIFSSSPIPGNLISINKIIDQLSRRGATVIHHKLRNIHASGHGAQEELKLMLQLLNPKFFMPIHGEYRMLKKHTELAVDCGVPLERSFILDNGEILELNSESAMKGKKVPAKPIYVDGDGIGDIGTIVLRDRHIMSESGILSIVICIDKKNLAIIAGPEIITRGFVYMNQSRDLINSLSDIVNLTIKQLFQKSTPHRTEIKRKIIDSVLQFIYDETKRKPIVIPIIMEV